MNRDVGMGECVSIERHLGRFSAMMGRGFGISLGVNDNCRSTSSYV